MPKRLAGACAILAFAVCLVIGAFQADNPFATAVLRALAAMGGTFVVGLLVGAMAQKMLNENLENMKKLKAEKIEEEKDKNSEAKTIPNDR